MKPSTRFLSAGLLALSASWLVACGGGGDGESKVAAPTAGTPGGVTAAGGASSGGGAAAGGGSSGGGGAADGGGAAGGGATAVGGGTGGVPADRPAEYRVFADTDLTGSTLVTPGGEIVVSGGSVAVTSAAPSDQGAVVLLCKSSENLSDPSAVLIGSGLVEVVAPADLNGLIFDEVRCGPGNGDWVKSGAYVSVAGGIASFYEAGVASGQSSMAAILGAGSNDYSAELGTLRARAFRRPGGDLVLVASWTGGTQPPPAGEPPGVALYVQR